MIQPKRILYAEDDPRDIELTLVALADHKLTNEIVIVNDGEEALDYLYKRGNFQKRGNGNPALILLDIKMPKVDGLEVLRQVKSDPDLKAIPVVILTSSREEKDLIAGYNLGVNAFVVKPVGFPNFVDAIKEIGLFWALLNEPPVGSIPKQ